ncbi:GH25 family lysozyme [Tenacibaculum ovolyticum]|uniref:GH25 family lysozyme n=1 Tax=Tenacibaculum ovolyticum TaxID=104270 RepID=UPI0003FC7CBA|nr:GH25 family lysozyme [Tenacibaculum ovolyticum]
MKKQISIFILLTISFFSYSQPKKEVKVTSDVPLFVYGIDISKYQGDEITELSKQKDSLSFIICKATEGITYTDPKFSYNWKMIKEKSFIRGVYHFYRSDDDPIAQANHFTNTIGSIKKSDIPPIIDFEAGGIDVSQSVEEVQHTLKIFINQLEKTLDRKPIIYTSVFTGNKYLNDSFFANYKLWIANYNGEKSPDLPNTWKEKGWLIWQRSDSYKLDGVTDDLDMFNGSLEEFKIFIKNSSIK